MIKKQNIDNKYNKKNQHWFNVKDEHLSIL